jgi:hypothetical protein
LASTRGDKGLSAVVDEALEIYLQAHIGRAGAIQKALGLKGSMRATDAAILLRRTRRIHANWR